MSKLDLSKRSIIQLNRSKMHPRQAQPKNRIQNWAFNTKFIFKMRISFQSMNACFISQNNIKSKKGGVVRSSKNVFYLIKAVSCLVSKRVGEKFFLCVCVLVLKSSRVTQVLSSHRCDKVINENLLNCRLSFFATVLDSFC